MSAKFVGKREPYGGAQPPSLGYVQVPSEDWKKAVKDKVRSRVIVQDALLNDILGILIELKLQPRYADAWEALIGRHGALEDTNNRARLACVLGLIKKETMQDLCFLHNIRNKFAHLAKPDFSDPDLAREILKLSTVGNRRDEVTQANYMGFYDETLEKCKQAIVEGIRQTTTEPQGKPRRGRNRISLVDAVAGL